MPNPSPHLLFRLRRTIKGLSCTFGTTNPNSCTFGNSNSCNPTSRLFADAFPTIVSLSKRTISLKNMFVFIHIVSHVPNFLWDKQARAVHAPWILYGKNLKEITLISTKICYRSILANVLMNSGKCMTA